ncbi:ankyrin repeat domain-containing protein [Parashewanella curva]|uniref:Ankyrin repeat domain-containing protein n=1 Tax=Parashewanella curva TaxID=2338552 RepID=A0A3L8PZ46_9GAMM|nr:ankyrin repeat domain-containing protein [Parashewanella curva]RLV59863.1 ankyrin repeat domain-containing protein [Parashewanella curva]
MAAKCQSVSIPFNIDEMQFNGANTTKLLTEIAKSQQEQLLCLSVSLKGKCAELVYELTPKFNGEGFDVFHHKSRSTLTIKNGLLSKVKLKIESSFNGHSGIYTAIDHGDLNEVTNQLSQGCNLSIQHKVHGTAFQFALRKGHFAIATEIQRYVMFSCQDLFVAIESDCIHLITQWLLSQKIDQKLLFDAIKYAITHHRDFTAMKCFHALTNAKDVELLNALMLHSVKVDNVFWVYRLASKGADVNQSYDFASNVLTYSIVLGNTETALALVDLGADIHTRTLLGDTPLLLAAENGEISLCASLLTKGANVNNRDINGNTPLHFAVQNSNHQLLELFLEFSPEILVNNDGNSALQLAIQSKDIFSMEQLLNYGLSNEKAFYTTWLLVVATQYISSEPNSTFAQFYYCARSVFDDDFKNTKISVDVYPKLRLQLRLLKNNDTSSIHDLLYEEDTQIKIEELLIKLVNEGDKRHALIERLIEHWGISDQNDFKSIELMSDALRGNSYRVFYLLFNKYKPQFEGDRIISIRRKEAEESLQCRLADKGNGSRIYRMIKESVGNYCSFLSNSLMFLTACKQSNCDLAMHLIREKLDLTITDELEATPLLYACQNGLEPVVVFLLNTKELDFYKLNIHKQSPLHWASISGHISIIYVLLKKKFDVTRQDGLGFTPLHYAIQQGQNGAAHILIDHLCERNQLKELLNPDDCHGGLIKFCENHNSLELKQYLEKLNSSWKVQLTSAVDETML